MRNLLLSITFCLSSINLFANDFLKEKEKTDKQIVEEVVLLGCNSIQTSCGVWSTVCFGNNMTFWGAIFALIDNDITVCSDPDFQN